VGWSVWASVIHPPWPRIQNTDQSTTGECKWRYVAGGCPQTCDPSGARGARTSGHRKDEETEKEEESRLRHHHGQRSERRNQGTARCEGPAAELCEVVNGTTANESREMRSVVPSALFRGHHLTTPVKREKISHFANHACSHKPSRTISKLQGLCMNGFGVTAFVSLFSAKVSTRQRSLQFEDSALRRFGPHFSSGPD
jgi:hypothetical protein